VKTRIYARRLDKLILSDPPKWRVFLEAAWFVAPFWAVAILVLVASFCLSLFYRSGIPLTVGGYIIALMALIFGLFWNAEAEFINWLEAFTRRLASPNEGAARFSAGYTEVNRLIGKWRKAYGHGSKSAPARPTCHKPSSAALPDAG
jgi:hypothetical protein